MAAPLPPDYFYGISLSNSGASFRETFDVEDTRHFQKVVLPSTDPATAEALFIEYAKSRVEKYLRLYFSNDLTLGEAMDCLRASLTSEDYPS